MSRIGSNLLDHEAGVQNEAPSLHSLFQERGSLLWAAERVVLEYIHQIVVVKVDGAALDGVPLYNVAQRALNVPRSISQRLPSLRAGREA